MVAQHFIPVGRTAQVDRELGAEGTKPLQVQTEYAYRPYPRITTTIFDSGQVLHKIELKLAQPINSEKEQQHAENIIRRQHAEVIALLKQQKSRSIAPAEKAQKISQKPSTNTDRFKQIPGIEYLFHLDNKGNFIGSASQKQFKKKFSAIFKHVPELMEIFTLLPGTESQREHGVYEIERDRLYFVSVGDCYYFLTVKRVDHDTDYEKTIKEIVKTGL